MRSIFSALIAFALSTPMAYAIQENPRHTIAGSDIAARSSNTVKETRWSNTSVSGAPGQKGYDKKVLAAALRLLKRDPQGVSFKLTYQTTVDGHVVADQHYFQFTQMDDGYPMEGMGISVMMMKSSKNWMIRMVDLRYVPVDEERHVAKPAKNSRFLTASAFALARNVLGDVNKPLFRDRARLIRIDGQWKLIRQIQFAGLGEQVLVDVQTGKAWKESDKHYAERSLVTGLGSFAGPTKRTTTLMDLPMNGLKLSYGENQFVWADQTGHFELPFGLGAQTLNAGLQGRWANVSTESGPELKLEAAIESDTAELKFPVNAEDEQALAQTNAFFHVSRVHDWLNAHGVKHADFDKPVGAVTNIDDYCNAYYTGGIVHFFKSGGDDETSCVNTSYDSVVYHEYGHLVDDALGGITEGGLSEAWGDILSMFILGIPEVGKDFFSKGRENANYIRTGENTYKYPEDEWEEPHRLGQAWMGFAWKLRLALINKYGPEKGEALAEDLILPSLMSNALDIPQALRETLVRDDNDGDLRNGAPDFDEILAAATIHGLEGYVKTK